MLPPFERNMMKRLGTVVGIKEPLIEVYKELHAEAWPAVLELLAEAHIHNYSIYLRKMPDGKHYLLRSEGLIPRSLLR